MDLPHTRSQLALSGKPSVTWPPFTRISVTTSLQYRTSLWPSSGRLLFFKERSTGLLPGLVDSQKEEENELEEKEFTSSFQLEN